MPSNWAKGFTKYSHPSVLKISETMKRKKIDNFAKWRIHAKNQGVIPSNYPQFKKDGDLAELLGVVYGDGNISKFPRTERLLIAANSSNKGFIERYYSLVKKIFNKEPTAMKVYNANCVRISIYQNRISERLGIPCGSRSNLTFIMPSWIRDKPEILKRFLRGLFEAEGCFCVHKPTSTYKLIFNNKNDSLFVCIIYPSLLISHEDAVIYIFLNGLG